MAAYSAGIQIAVIPFGGWSFSGQGTRLRDAVAGVSFDVPVSNGCIRLTAGRPGYRNRIAVDLDGAGSLTAYRHEPGAHRLALSLGAALPLALVAPRAAREFALHLDRNEPVARGTVVSEPTASGRRLT